MSLRLKTRESSGDGRRELRKSKMEIDSRLSLGDSVEVVNLLLLLFIESRPDEESENSQIDKSSSSEPVSDGGSQIEVENESQRQEVIGAIEDLSEQINGGVGDVKNGISVLLNGLSRDSEVDILESLLEGILYSLSLKPRSFQNDIVGKSKGNG